MGRRILPLLLLVGLVAASCAESDLELSVERPGERRTNAQEGTDGDEVVEQALADLEAYWSDELDDVYDVEFAPLRGGYVPYGPTTSLPRCGLDALTYDEIAENALYCPEEDLIAWDRVALVPDLQERFGPLTVGLVMAHEFAHAIQARGGVRGATVTLEVQADCFAGAWVADARERIDVFATEGDALDQAMAGLLELRDSLGISGLDPAAHGSGFDRVSAFQDGFEGGPEVCAAYEETPPQVVAIPFGTLDDQISGGNLPLVDLLEPLRLDLESFFRALVTDQGGRWARVRLDRFDPDDGPIRCGPAEVAGDELDLASFYCASDDTAYMDTDELIPELEQIGDFAFAGELARLYAFAAQEQLGIEDDDPVREGLHADCVSGVYTAAQFFGEIPEQELQLSPGDVDEIIIAFLAFGGETEASAFDRTAAFRTGFVNGFEACERVLD